MSGDIDGVLLDVANRLVGLHCWQASLGHGSFVTLDLGGRRLSSAGLEVGEFHIWVYNGQWDIRHGGELLGCDSDERPRMELAAGGLLGRSIGHFDIDRQTTRLRIGFDGDLELVVEPHADEDMDEWLIFTDDGMVLSAGGGTLAYESAVRS